VVVSLDLPFGRNGGGFPRWKVPTYRMFARQGQTLHLVRGDSHDPASFDAVKRLLGDRKIDFMMIDGDHSADGVRKDFEMYKTLCSDDAVIALHDILKNRFDPSISVDEFWNEIKNAYDTEEIVDDPDQGNLGIGLVHLGTRKALN
jgi:hypothetical protein